MSPEVLQELSLRLCAELELPLDMVVSAKSRSMSMKLDAKSGRIRVGIPAYASARSVEDFVRSNIRWARIRADAAAERIRFLPGVQVPVNGVLYTIRQDPSARFPARLVQGEDGPEILVGRTVTPERHVGVLLRTEALRRMESLTREKAAIIGRKVGSVCVKDTSSRWGSCASTGDICYSWRMVLAPPEISDYLAAHEVAHLVEMNHSGRFWKICGSLSGIPRARASAWLTRNGGGLMRYGPPS
jgi:predicted metal-dependent hydrolase